MSTPNAELAYRVLDHIDAHPEQWDQERWWRPAEMAPGTACGTAGCFAGWAVALSGGRMARGEITAVVQVASGLGEWNGTYVPVAAAALLGLPMEDPHSEDEAENQELFEERNSREDLGRLVAEIFGPRPVGSWRWRHDPCGNIVALGDHVQAGERCPGCGRTDLRDWTPIDLPAPEPVALEYDDAPPNAGSAS